MPKPNKPSANEALGLWRQHCENVQAATALLGSETDRQRQQRIARLRGDAGIQQRVGFRRAL